MICCKNVVNVALLLNLMSVRLCANTYILCICYYLAFVSYSIPLSASESYPHPHFQKNFNLFLIQDISHSLGVWFLSLSIITSRTPTMSKNCSLNLKCSQCLISFVPLTISSFIPSVSFSYPLSSPTTTSKPPVF